jgi:hypothetical protein
VAEIEGIREKGNRNVLGEYDMSVTLLFSVNLLMLKAVIDAEQVDSNSRKYKGVEGRPFFGR